MADDSPVAQVLDAAKCCTVVLIIGRGMIGELYAACSTDDKFAIMELLEAFTEAVESGRYG